jgi:hypothetical protein
MSTLYCEECDQRFSSKGGPYPLHDHGRCTDCRGRLVPYNFGEDKYGNVGRRYDDYDGELDQRDARNVRPQDFE